jgi:hypothetical protein
MNIRNTFHKEYDMFTKKITLVLAGLYCSSMMAHAQINQVLDVANLMQSIETLYATYDEITQAIENVHNTYKQIENQIKMVQSINWNEIGEAFKDMDPTSLEGVLNIRNQLKDVGYLINRNLNLINAVEDTLTKKVTKFGGKEYTIGGLFGFGKTGTTIFDLPKNLFDYVDETAEDLVAGYAGKLTYKQKEAIMRRYNISPRNYAKWRFVEETYGSLLQDMFTTSSQEHAAALMEEARFNAEGIDAMIMEADESMVAQQQVTTQALLNMTNAVVRLEIGLNNVGGMIAQKEVADRQINELKAAQQEINQKLRENERIKWTGIKDYQ